MFSSWLRAQDLLPGEYFLTNFFQLHVLIKEMSSSYSCICKNSLYLGFTKQSVLETASTKVHTDTSFFCLGT